EGSFARALAMLARGDHAAAADVLGALLEVEQVPLQRALLLNKRGVALIGCGHREAAEADFEAALACRPSYAPALVNLGNMLLEADRVEDAVARYEAAITADGDYARAHFNASIAYKRQGRFDDAVRALRTAQKLEGRIRRKPSRGQ
ncbi:MAG TPA: tetratricopeptide repeat protein, partial [Candidatus Baltobacteraceae bacterium]|nr:tetratricopeptide repeat protein [Candidatus Baltobacteraceae bacterium]